MAELSEEMTREGVSLVEQSVRAAKLDEVSVEISRMAVEKTRYEETLKTQSDSQAKVYAYLQKKLVDSTEQLAALQDAVARAEASFLEKQQRAAQEAVAQQEDKSSSLGAMEARVEALRQQTETLQRFAAARPALEAKCKELEETVARRRKAHAESLAMLDEKNDIERAKLEADMAAAISETTASIEAHAKGMLPDATKRTMMDIEKISGELDYQTHEVSKLRERCGAIEAGNTTLRAKLVDAKKAETVVARKLHLRQREFKRLERELAALESENNEGGGGAGAGAGGRGAGNSRGRGNGGRKRAGKRGKRCRAE